MGKKAGLIAEFEGRPRANDFGKRSRWPPKRKKLLEILFVKTQRTLSDAARVVTKVLIQSSCLRASVPAFSAFPAFANLSPSPASYLSRISTLRLVGDSFSRLLPRFALGSTPHPWNPDFFLPAYPASFAPLASCFPPPGNLASCFSSPHPEPTFHSP